MAASKALQQNSFYIIYSNCKLISHLTNRYYLVVFSLRLKAPPQGLEIEKKTQKGGITMSV